MEIKRKKESHVKGERDDKEEDVRGTFSNQKPFPQNKNVSEGEKQTKQKRGHRRAFGSRIGGPLNWLDGGTGGCAVRLVANENRARNKSNRRVLEIRVASR